MAEPGEHPEVFGADEQQAVAIDVLRWTGLARFVLIAERAPAGGELSLIFVDEEAITELNERFLAGTGATDVLAFPLEDDPPLGGRQPDQGGRGPGSPAAPSDPQWSSEMWSCARRSWSVTPSTTETLSTTNSAVSWCTGSFIFWTTTTVTTTRPRR
ncbi:MAG: rRNA maturation RNAse YbeY [Acidimicrobiia bacterium]|nr:rRNA maturation RNAse YbeY [Acidimicrobiia bacterium]